MKLFCAGSTPAAACAAAELERNGWEVANTLRWDTAHLLLDVPSFRDGKLRSGESPDTLFSSLPANVRIWGGNLEHPGLKGFHATDLLRDEAYLLENAAITADCAMEIAAPLISAPLSHTPALIIGWGRIGKYLADILKDAGCPVTVAARKQEDRSALKSLGFQTAYPAKLEDTLPAFRLIFNTAPAPVICAEQARLCADCVKIDLASVTGIAGENVILARGLPGAMAPERSGRLIAHTILRRIREETA